MGQTDVWTGARPPTPADLRALPLTTTDGKAQWIRLADVFLVGPVMIWGGVEVARGKPVPGIALGALGVATILYNGYNFFRLGGVQSMLGEIVESSV